MADVEAIKAREKAFHERLRAKGDPRPVQIEAFARDHLAPCYDTGLYRADNKRVLHDLIRRDGGWEGRTVLDYACGNGVWATYFALTGAETVHGFDLAESGIQTARDRAKGMGLSHKLFFDVQDASDLTYPDASFDTVVGVGALHHVVKYPGVFDHLHRILKPGGKAYFLENLADFPLWRLYWWWKGEVEEGDVPLFAETLREEAGQFSDVEIIGDTFFSAVKLAIWRLNPRGLRRAALRASFRADDIAFRLCPALRKWGAFSYIILTR